MSQSYFWLGVVLICVLIMAWFEFQPVALANQGRDGWFIVAEGWRVFLHSWHTLAVGIVIGGGLIWFLLYNSIENDVKTEYERREDALILERDSAMKNAEKWLRGHLSEIKNREQRAEAKLQEAHRFVRLSQQEIEQKKFELKRIHNEQLKLEQRLKNSMATSKRLRKKIDQV